MKSHCHRLPISGQYSDLNDVYICNVLASMSQLSQMWQQLPESDKKDWSDKEQEITQCCTKRKGINDLVSSLRSNVHCFFVLLCLSCMLQLSNLSKLGVEGYTSLLNLESSESQLMTTSDKIDSFVEHEQIEDKLFKYMCGKYMYVMYI